MSGSQQVAAALAQPYGFGLLLSSLVCLAIAAFSWLYRHVPSARMLVLLMLGGAVWAAADLLQVASVDPTAKLFWARMSYLGICSVPVFWLLFASAYAVPGHRPGPRTIALLLAVPAISVVLTWTPGLHALMWTPVSGQDPAPGRVLQMERGPWFWLHVAYSYSMLVAGAVFVTRLLRGPFARRQAVALVVGLLAPWGLNALRLSGWQALEGVDLTPFAVSLSGTAAALSLFYFRVQDLLPAARETIVESLSEGILLLDQQGRVLRCNPAAARLLGVSEERATFRALHELVPAVPEGPVRGSTAVEARVGEAGRRRDLELRFSTLGPEVGRAAGYVALIRDVTERRALEQQLEHIAFHDPVTGLPNRRAFERELARVLEAGGSGPGACAVCLVDLENLDVVGRSLGREVEDRLLLAAGERLAAAVGDSGYLARWEGQQFVILRRDLARPDAPSLATRSIERAFDAGFRLDHREFVLAVRAGTAVAGRSHSRGADLLRDAQLALARAMGEHQARFQVFEPAMAEEARDRVELEEALRRAIDLGGLELAYQPIVDAAAGRPLAFEALLRWQLPGRGRISPLRFVRIAEQTGMIVALGHWVLKTACAQLRDFSRTEDGLQCSMSVNVAAGQFASDRLVGQVAETLSDNGLEASRLWLEITETDLVRDVDATAAQLAALRRMGVKVAVDDFGTGHSALSYLRQFPVDTLKIDRAFVQPLGRSPADSVLVRGIAQLGHALGLELTAEGVETARQLELVRELGCDMAQGYWFAAPAPAEQAIAWFRAAAGTTRAAPVADHGD